MVIIDQYIEKSIAKVLLQVWHWRAIRVEKS